MAFKLIVLSALVAYASAGAIPLAYHAAPALAYETHAAPALAYEAHAAPLAVHTKSVDAEYDPHPQYSYGYDVHDAHTGDIKSQHESRDGDIVHGSYSLVDPDGTKRTVKYTADPHNGFNAVVEKEPLHQHVAVHHAPALAYHAEPTYLAHHHEPLAYAAPAAYAHHHY